MKHFEGTTDGLHYDVIEMTPPWVADPDTLVFHHGVGSNSDIWSKWIPILGPHYRLVRFDMRGLGKSAAGARDDGWTFDSFAGDVIKVADAAGVQRFHYVGESFGGTVGLVLALRHPGRLHTLTVSNAAFLGSAIQNVSEWERLLTTEGPLAWSKMMMASRFYEGALTPEEWAWFEAQQAGHPVKSVVAGRNALVDADLSSHLRGLDIAVLLMHGDASPFVPVKQMAELHALLPRSELQIFNHARHGLPFSHAQECARTVLEFLQRNRR